MSVVSLNNDRSANKLAFCSAVVAGFAYVGYTVFRSALNRRQKKKEVEHRIFLRRLSQTTQTDALLGDLNFDGSNKIIIKPKSVQERIRELNVQARQFADAVTAIQGNGNPRFGGVSARSLQVTPWGSPRLLSPVDIRHFPPGHSPEPGDSGDYRDKASPCGSPKRHRWSRGSLATNRKVEFHIPEDGRVKECNHLWAEERENIMNDLPKLLGGQRELTFRESQYLIAILNSDDKSLVTETLISIANYAAFSVNQDTFREAGLIAFLPKLILNPNRQIKLKAFLVVSNMALNEKNNLEMEFVASSLANSIQMTSLVDPALLTGALSALTNIMVLNNWHNETKCILHKLYSLLDEGHWNRDGFSHQSLRLLINLSCNEDMVPSLLAAEAPGKLIYMLDLSMPEDIILRITTLLANLATVAKKMNIDPIYDLPPENKAAAPDTMYAAIFGLSITERFKRKAQILCERLQNEDLQVQAQRLLVALSE